MLRPAGLLPDTLPVILGRYRTCGWGTCAWIGSGVSIVAPFSEPPTDQSLPGGEIAAFEALIGVSFADHDLLRAALTHPSYSNEHPEDPAPTNERLEFLGDAILGAIVAEDLYTRFPQVQEGRLTEWRSALVCGPTLSRVAIEVIDLGPWLRLGRGEEQTGGRDREGNLERAYEAIVGAVYLDRGYPEATAFVHRTLGAEIEALARDPGVLNPKGTLQQLAQERLGRPEYRLVAQDGPEHDRQFTVEVHLSGQMLGRGRAGTKQEAEKEAARQALPRVRALADAAPIVELGQTEAGEHGTAGGTAVPRSGS
jgi:ribonuclease-3